jgi:hypothetical protein
MFAGFGAEDFNSSFVSAVSVFVFIGTFNPLLKLYLLNAEK